MASSDMAISVLTGWAPDCFTCDVDATMRARRSSGWASLVAIVIGAIEYSLPDTGLLPMASASPAAA